MYDCYKPAMSQIEMVPTLLVRQIGIVFQFVNFNLYTAYKSKDIGLTLISVPLVSSRYCFKVYIILHMKFSFKYNEENNENMRN